MYCDAFEEDGRPENVFVAREKVDEGTLDEIPW
jgi:hypothetical protein